MNLEESNNQEHKHKMGATMVDRSLDCGSSLSRRGLVMSEGELARAMVDRDFLLPPSFSPGPWDVICSRGSSSSNSDGNLRLKSMIHSHMAEYLKADKSERKQLVSKIIDKILENSEYGFVRQDQETQRWYKVKRRIAREKVGQGLRAALKKKGWYKSTERGSPSLESGSERSQQRSERSNSVMDSAASSARSLSLTSQDPAVSSFQGDLSTSRQPYSAAGSMHSLRAFQGLHQVPMNDGFRPIQQYQPSMQHIPRDLNAPLAGFDLSTGRIARSQPAYSQLSAPLPSFQDALGTNPVLFDSSSRLFEQQGLLPNFGGPSRDAMQLYANRQAQELERRSYQDEALLHAMAGQPVMPNASQTTFGRASLAELSDHLTVQNTSMRPSSMPLIGPDDGEVNARPFSLNERFLQSQMNPSLQNHDQSFMQRGLLEPNPVARIPLNRQSSLHSIGLGDIPYPNPLPEAWDPLPFDNTNIHDQSNAEDGKIG